MKSHTLDAYLDLIADRHRRRAVQHLRRETDGTTTLEDLVDRVYSDVSDAKVDPRRGREELAIQLQHTHLPKLADHGVVEFEHGSGIVRYLPDEDLEAVLDSLPREVSMPEP